MTAVAPTGSNSKLPQQGSHTTTMPNEDRLNSHQLEMLMELMGQGKSGRRAGGRGFLSEDVDEFVADPVLIQDFIKKMDEHVKLLLLFMMFSATLIWGVFFYWFHHLPRELFAWQEIENVFLPSTYWSGIYILIGCPWLAGLYCLFVVVYPDPRQWRFCIRPRRPMRWVPYILTLMYTIIVKTYWFYSMFLIPSSLKHRMRRRIDSSLNTYSIKFPEAWEYIHNYCCGMENKLDWKNKLIPKFELPYPFKNETVCKDFKYGVVYPPNIGCFCFFQDEDTGDGGASSETVASEASLLEDVRRDNQML